MVTTAAQGINDQGQIVGYCGTNGPNPTGSNAFFRDVNGTITVLNQPGWVSSWATGINNAGQIVGNFIDNAGNHGFFRDAGGTISILEGTAYGINNHGQILGLTYATDGSRLLYVASISNRSGVLAHIAAGGGWTTVITLINNSPVAVPVTVTLHSDNGDTLSLPVTTTLQGVSQTITGASVNATINPYATWLILTGDQVASAVIVTPAAPTS